VSTERTIYKHSLLLGCSASFALLWIVARACVQSITIDEADTYLSFVRTPSPTHWGAAANNHVLNSLLMRLVTMIFPASELTLRLPALTGSALYIGAVYCLVRLISERRLLQWSLFICLVFSPFVMDYLVAARGYSLALGFLACAITLAVHHQAQDALARAATHYRTCMLISACAALSVSANFSFAIADALTALGLLVWVCRKRPASYLRTLAACVAPGLAITYFLVGPALLSWPRSQFTWGAKSLLEMFHSIFRAVLFEPNEYFLNPPLHYCFVHFGAILFPALGYFLAWRLVALFLTRTAPRDAAARRLGALAMICGGAVVLALAIHQVLYMVAGILLPLDRTALYVYLLVLLPVGAMAAIEVPTWMGNGSRRAMTVTLFLLACYSLGCLRLTYFKEWKYDADVKRVYSVLAYYNHACGVTDVSVNWRYSSALSAYREMSGHETIKEFPPSPLVVDSYPPKYQAYVVYAAWDSGFVQREGLKVVYLDRFTDAEVAVRPEVEQLCKR
jgi:hypothetical protein